jgi:N-glycosylase/DNA lyase
LFYYVNGDFDLHLALMGGQAFRWQSNEGGYRGVIGGLSLEVSQHQGLFRIQVGNRGNHEKLSGEDICRYLEWYFRVDENSQGIRAILCEDQVLAPIVRNLGVLRILRQDPWECIVSYICSIDSNIPKIRTNIGNICRLFGKEIPTDSGVTEHAFPPMQVIADSSEEELRSLGLGFRAPYLLKTAQNLVSGEFDFSEMRRQNIDKVRADLQTLPGIGPKVADCVLLYSLDRLDAFPIDRWVRRAVSNLYFRGEPIPDKDIKAWALVRFGALSGYAQQYLFEWSRSEQIREAPIR